MQKLQNCWIFNVFDQKKISKTNFLNLSCLKALFCYLRSFGTYDFFLWINKQVVRDLGLLDF